MDEIALLNGVSRLDPRALSEVHDRYYPAIFRFIAYKIGNHETAEDLTSEVFVRLLDAVQKCNAPNKTVLGWLYCVASHLVNDYYRKQYRSKQEVVLSELVPCEDTDPAEQLINKQAVEALRDALSELSDDQQNVIALRFGCAMPIKEVAMMIGRSEGAVKQLQARAVAALSRKLRFQGL
jgi:RNA polymerase sigma-70 factor (ECF subfamily)